MAPRLAIVVALAGCGRIGFDPAPADRAADAGSDGAPSDAIAQVIPPGAKIWLRMETDPNQSIVDSAGGHAASCTPDCPMPATGVHGQGYRFGAQEIDVQDAPDLDSSAGFTAAVWVQLTALPTSLACVWSKPFNAAAGFDTFTLCIQPDGTTTFDSETPAGVADSESGPTMALGQWHHLAMSWDGTTKRGYFDGAQATTSVVQLGHGTEHATLGGEDGGFYTPALVDDALYYTRALGAAEVGQLATP